MQDTFQYATLIHPDDVDRIAQEVADYFQSGINTYEQSYRLKIKDRGYHWFYDFTKLQRDENGNVITIRGYLFDQTQLKQAEQELQASEEKYRLLVDRSYDIIYTFDMEGVFTFVSPSWKHLLGHDIEQVVGKSIYEFIHPEDISLCKEHIKLIMDSGHREEGTEYRALHLDGSWRWHLSGAVPIRDEAGNITGVSGIARDITERKLAEEEKNKLEAQLQQVQKMESVGRLAGGVAHDFNNMLSVILGHTEMALELVNPSETLYSDLEEIRKAAVRSADLTRQLLAFARKQTVTPKILDLNITVEGMLKMLKRLIGEDIELIWKPGENLWPVRMDLSQIDQIMANLCINSRDAIAGVGKVTIETQNCVFDSEYVDEHASFEPGEYVQLVISDTGCGMDRETLAHIFEPFFTTKSVGEGTGLGLATVYGIIKQNNGYINAYSESGIGTTFKIYIPRHKPITAAVIEKAPPPIERGHETILLVEDEATILRMTKRILELQGYTVISASTPGEAINKAKTHTAKIDLLITDVIMPEMNGRDLANNLLAIFPNLKRLFMSGYTANVIAHHGVLDAGVNFIQKPFTMKNLAAIVRDTLNQN